MDSTGNGNARSLKNELDFFQFIDILFDCVSSLTQECWKGRTVYQVIHLSSNMRDIIYSHYRPSHDWNDLK